MSDSSYPPGSCGCINLLIPVGLVAGVWVGYRSGGWVGGLIGVPVGILGALVLLALSASLAMMGTSRKR